MRNIWARITFVGARIVSAGRAALAADGAPHAGGRPPLRLRQPGHGRGRLHRRRAAGGGAAGSRRGGGGGGEGGGAGGHGRAAGRAHRAGRARPHCRCVRPLVHVIPYSLRESVSLFLKRQCDRTLRAGPGRARGGRSGLRGGPAAARRRRRQTRLCRVARGPARAAAPGAGGVARRPFAPADGRAAAAGGNLKFTGLAQNLGQF